MSELKAIHITQIGNQQLDELRQLSILTFEETFAAHNTAENMSQYLDQSFSTQKLREELSTPEASFFQAYWQNEAIAYLKINLHPPMASQAKSLEIERIYVLAKYHGKNVGESLLNKAIQIAILQHCPTIWLGVWENNPRAIRFYEKHGFTPYGSHDFLLGEDLQRDILMRKEVPVFPDIHSPRLYLRLLQTKDFPNLVNQCHDKSIAEQIINIPYPYTLADAEERLQFILSGFAIQKRFVFLITEKATGKLMGEIGLHLDEDKQLAQFGYWIGRDFRSQGYATEACAAILQFGFKQLGLLNIYATHYPENTASGRVMQKNHMLKDATPQEPILVDGKQKDVIRYNICLLAYRELNQSGF